jgi:hypothetical protein
MNGQCQFRGCTRQARALGMCDGHYRQLRRGSGLKALREEVTPRERSQVVSARLLHEDVDLLVAQARKKGLTLHAYLSEQLRKLAQRLAA